MKDYEKVFIDKCRISIQKQKFGNMTGCTVIARRKFLGDPLYVAKIETDSDKTFWGIGNESDQGFYSYPASGSSTAFSSFVGELVQKTPHLITNYTEPPRGGKKYHAFISHAWEDKEKFVKPLAENLINIGFSIWYDDISLTVGKSLRQEIDNGLRRSRYGIVILSKSFFKKNWPNYELNGLVELNQSTKRSVIIPIWYEVEKKDVLKFSAPLSDLIAYVSTKMTLDEIASAIAGNLAD
jgi:hypothetical protein